MDKAKSERERTNCGYKIQFVLFLCLENYKIFEVVK